MSGAHAACVCAPRAAGPPCSQGGFCSPAMMDGRAGPFRPPCYSSGIYITLAFHRSPLTLPGPARGPQAAPAPLIPLRPSPTAPCAGPGVPTATGMLWVRTRGALPVPPRRCPREQSTPSLPKTLPRPHWPHPGLVLVLGEGVGLWERRVVVGAASREGRGLLSRWHRDPPSTWRRGLEERSSPFSPSLIQHQASSQL